MTNKQIATILAILILMPSTLWASWKTPDKGYFNTQKDIEKAVADASRTSATIAFGGKLYNFINYGADGVESKIIVRELTNIGKSDSIKWECKKNDNIPTLKHLGFSSFQPAPVVFKDQLILFVCDRAGKLNYSTYNPSTNDQDTNSWSSLTKLNEIYHYDFYQFYPHEMSAVVIGKKLCLVILGYNGKTFIFSTEDLVRWVSTPIDIPSVDNEDWEISVVTQTYMKGNALEEKLLIGYINTYQHAWCAEYDLSDSGHFTKISDKSIAYDQEYSSVTLVPGSVAGDPSTGNMVQAFLKKAKLDDWYQRHRILRYQTIIDENGESEEWTKQENNLVKQNYLWASKKVNLTAANFPVIDGKTIRQYMCLIYRGYDDWDHPLNCAWVETDKLEQTGKDQQQTLTGPENTQYIGYIEGPPPFYKNNEAGLDAPLNGPTAEWISSAEYGCDVETSDDKKFKFTIERKVIRGFKGFKATCSEEYARIKDVVTTTTISHKIGVHPTDESLGHYITLQPILSRADYEVQDVHGQYLYTTYYFWLSPPHLINETVTGLADSKLDQQFPGKYMNRGIDFELFDSFIDKNVSTDVSWATGLSNSVTLKVTEEKATTNTWTAKFELEVEVSIELLNVGGGLSGSIELEITTTTKTGNEVTCATDLNDPVKDTDLSALAYTVHWIMPTKDCDNWWLYPGQDPKQKTWCLTYDVYYMQTKGGNATWRIKYETNENPGFSHHKHDGLRVGMGLHHNPHR